MLCLNIRLGLSFPAVLKAPSDASKFMRKVLSISIFILLFANLGYGQSPTTEPKLIGVFKPVYYEDIYDKLDNLLIKLGNEITPEKNYLAIRICSNDPLPVAFSLAKGMPQYVIENIKRYNPLFEFNTPQITILKNNANCEIKKNEYYLTEYWAVNNNAQDLKFTESENFENIIVSEIKIDSKSKQQIIETLKSNKNSWIIVKMSVKQKNIPREIQRLQRFLRGNKIQKDRIFVKKLQFLDKKSNSLLLVEKVTN